MINYDRRFITNKLNLNKNKQIKEKNHKKGYIILAMIALIILFLI